MARPDTVGEESKVIVDLGADGSTPARPVSKRPTAPVRHTGPWVVILVYVVALTALALALYERFGT